MKLRQSETYFDLSICSQRVTRSSSDSIRNTKLMKKLPKVTQNNTITLKRGKESEKTLTEGFLRKVSIPFDDINPKRLVTRSSSGSVTGSSLKKYKLASEPENKSSKRLKKPNLCTISIPEKGNIDLLSSVSQSAVKRKKPSKLVSKKKSDVILSESQSNLNPPKPQSVVGKKNSITPKVSRRVTRSGLDVISVQSTRRSPKSQSVVSEKNPISLKVSRSITRSTLGNAAQSSSTQEEHRKLSASPVAQPRDKQVKVMKGQASKEKLSFQDEYFKRRTRSSLANPNGSSVPLRSKSPRCKSATKPTALVNPRKQTKKKSGTEEENSEFENSSSESVVDVAPPTRSTPKKAVPNDTHSVQRASRSFKLPNTSVLLTDLNISQNIQSKNRSSSANANNSSVLLRNKSQRCKSPTKPTALVNPRKQTKTKSGTEQDNSEFENSSSETVVDVAPTTRSTPKKAMPEDTHSVQRASRSSKLPNTSVLLTDLDTCQNTQSENIAVKPLEIRVTRLSASVSSTSTDSSSGTGKRSASSRSKSSLAIETEEKKSPKFKKPVGVKRKSNTPPAVETKRKRKMPPASTEEDPVSSQSTSADEKSKKHARRHTVDVLPKTKRPKNAPATQQQGKKKSPTVKGTNATSVKNLSSRSTPDISILPLDVISTFTAKRPKSAPAAIKKRSLSKVSTSTIPKKGTLKRKRWLADALKEKNKSYEDDIFENQKFATPFRIPTEADYESDTSIATPKFGFFLTPAVPKRTPKFKDIISPSNLVKARKNAEEYLYRRQNRNKKNKIITLKTPASSQTKASTKLGTIPEKKKLEFAEAMDKMQTIKSTIEAKAAEESDEEDEDNYLSDLSS